MSRSLRVVPWIEFRVILQVTFICGVLLLVVYLCFVGYCLWGVGFIVCGVLVYLLEVCSRF